MAQVVLRHPIHTPVRYQEQFEARGLEDCRLDHALFALPGPTTVDLGRAGAPTAETPPPGGPPEGPPEGPARFQVLLDVVQFLPEDILIQTCEGWLLVRARHGTRMDEHGFVSRAFTRQYRLPRGLGATHLRAALGHDGILVVEALRGAGAP
uniref:Heat shock protein family B (Small) member 3 n=2 Tax=Pipistrellus kuhlii TaxID=59472 RepID=A0A7J7YWD5_PIPKU|nr:heat shock protein family B (small) member 3 [Pipistrellus kuhlii]